jgi:cyanophycinase
MRCLVALGLLIASQSAAADAPFVSYLAGSADDAKATTRAGLVLMGGAEDTGSALDWLVGASGGGDVVVLRASGGAEYNERIRARGKVDSVETIVFRDRAASYNKSVRDKIRNAEALFIAGGDQWNYIRFWKDTPVQGAIHHLVWRGVPVAGTSAGLAILGEHSFAARNDTVTSAEALADPFGTKVTLASGFLQMPHLRGAITDSHFFQRDRMGRLIAFLARLRLDHKVVRGIGIDEATAVAVERDGTAKVLGRGNAYFVSLGPKPERCRRGQKLTAKGAVVYRIPAGGSFNLRTWHSDAVSTYEVSAVDGVLDSSSGSVY